MSEWMVGECTCGQVIPKSLICNAGDRCKWTSHLARILGDRIFALIDTSIVWTYSSQAASPRSRGRVSVELVAGKLEIRVRPHQPVRHKCRLPQHAQGSAATRFTDAPCTSRRLRVFGLEAFGESDASHSRVLNTLTSNPSKRFLRV